MVMKMGQTEWQLLTINTLHSVTEKQITYKDKMTSSNNNNYVLKSYLNVFKWVADRMQGCKVSNANIDFAFVVF